MLCVVGGKLSEGINFADELGRCVIVVGLPYPNKTSPVLAEKMSYFDAARRDNPQSLSGAAYYESLCMKAVNQAIGRCIRHRNDHATILLVDERYSQEQVVARLPGWIGKAATRAQSFGQAFAKVTKFFKQKAAAKATAKA